jgi:hypothetical protein
MLHLSFHRQKTVLLRLCSTMALTSILMLSACQSPDSAPQNAKVAQQQVPAGKPEFTLSVFRDYCKSLANGGDAQAIRTIVDTHGDKLQAKVKYITHDPYGIIVSLAVTGPPDVLAASFAGSLPERPECGEQCGESVARKGNMDFWVFTNGDAATGSMGILCRGFDPQAGQ